jgi:hypothetical protein
MAEFSRKVGYKKIECPYFSTTDPIDFPVRNPKVKVPVITDIGFLDSSDRGRETFFAVVNNSQSDREVHVASVVGYGLGSDETGKGIIGTDPDTGEPIYSPESTIQIERVDKWQVFDASGRGQETQISIDSRTVNQPGIPPFSTVSDDPSLAPPFFPTHAKTHLVKYINDPDDLAAVFSELIDEFHVGDASDRGQETQLTLLNPPDNSSIDGLIIGADPEDPYYPNITTIQIARDSSLTDISDSQNGIDNPPNDPWRIDPFQNIVDWSVDGWWIVVIGTVRLNGAYSCIVSCPKCNPDGSAGDLEQVFNLTDDSWYDYPTYVFRSTDGKNWDDVSGPCFEHFNGTAQAMSIQSRNGLLIATGPYAALTAILAARNCQDVSPPGNVFNYICETNGTAPQVGAAATKSLDGGKTWELIDADTNYAGVEAIWNGDDANSWKVTFHRNANPPFWNDEDIPFTIAAPWKAKKYPDGFVTSFPSGGRRTVRVIKSPDFTETWIQYSDDYETLGPGGGATWTTAKTVPLPYAVSGTGGGLTMFQVGVPKEGPSTVGD